MLPCKVSWSFFWSRQKASLTWVGKTGWWEGFFIFLCVHDSCYKVERWLGFISARSVNVEADYLGCLSLLITGLVNIALFLCKIHNFWFFVLVGRGGKTSAIDKTNVKKSVVSKSNTIKSMFMASAGKKNTDVSFYIFEFKYFWLVYSFSGSGVNQRLILFFCVKQDKLLLWSLVSGAFLKILYMFCGNPLVIYCCSPDWVCTYNWELCG